MNKQLIFLVETDRKCKSDWMYIKSTLDYFYGIRTDIHYEVIYLGGKTKYDKNEKQIEKLKKRFVNRNSFVFICIDLDNYQINLSDKNLNEKIKQYCNNKSYEMIWFNHNIEHDYLNEPKVESKAKKELSEKFMRKGMIQNVPNNKLMDSNYGIGKSNLLLVLDKYFKNKDD